ncbi:MAG: hypothetical protein NC218_07670 [Acetobacter sp.]|nr:hypothetical protein [Acetobacter sp.]
MPKVKMQKVLSLIVLLAGCTTLVIPESFTYKQIKTTNFEIASWQKITNPTATYRIYIEGDGNAFNAYGKPTTDPTPKGIFMRNLAFADTKPNVIYLARPCQYIKRGICQQRHWTSARFAPEIINAEYEVIKKIAGTNPVILIGYSGGAQIVGLLAAAKTGLNIKKIITIAGNLDHLVWTQYHNLPPLNESMNLADYQSQFAKIPQIHYVGEKDDIIPPSLSQQFINTPENLIIIPNATHIKGWESIYPQIYADN